MSRDKVISSKMKKAPFFDEYRCFSVGDFSESDSVIFLDEKKQRRKAYVTSVDMEHNLINVKTSSDEFSLNVNSIVFLDSFQRGWLD